jgi:hypothetical protein
MASDFIATRHGRRWHFLDPRIEDVDLEDIAYSLAHLSRFTGHAGSYSVATHSCHVADIVVMLGHPEFALDALTHDAHESYVGDVSSPLKRLLPDYRRIEAISATVVRRYFALPATPHDIVKRADLMAAHDEGSVFCPDVYFSGPFSGLPLAVEGPIEAMERWIGRVREAQRARAA